MAIAAITVPWSAAHSRRRGAKQPRGMGRSTLAPSAEALAQGELPAVLDGATLGESVPVAISATIALNEDAMTVAESAAVAVSETTAPKEDATTLTESEPVAVSAMLELNATRARTVSITEAASAIAALNVSDPVAAKGAAAKADPLNIRYPIRQRQG